MVNDFMAEGESFREAVAWYEKTILELALREAGGNKTEVCRRLRMPRQSLYNAMKRLGIPLEQEKAAKR